MKNHVMHLLTKLQALDILLQAGADPSIGTPLHLNTFVRCYKESKLKEDRFWLDLKQIMTTNHALPYLEAFHPFANKGNYSMNYCAITQCFWSLF